MKHFNLLASLFGCLALSASAASGLAPTVPIIPPYTLNVSDEAERNLYTLVDANDDGYTWEGNKWQFRCRTVEGTVADDWLFSPAIHLEAGKTYALQVVGFNKSSNWPERLEVKAGLSPQPESMTDVVLPVYTYTKVLPEQQNTTFTPASTGDYYIGFHCVSDAGGDYMNISSWSIAAPIENAAPDQATDVTITPGELGALTATIQFTAPVRNIDGSPLTSLSRAVVTNATAGKAVATVEALSPGQVCTVTDQAAVNGENRYTIVCYNGDLEGKPADATAFIGIDVPRAVPRGNWVQDGEDIVITWRAPSTTGVNGGYVDPDAVTYRIEMLMPTYKTLATGVHGLTYTDHSLRGMAGQAFVYYAIYPETVAGQGKGSPTFSGPYGTAINAPIHESFAGARLTYNPWFTIRHDGSDNTNWDIVATCSDPALSPFDADGGMAVMSGDDYGEWTLASPIIHLAEGESYQLTFQACQPDYANSLSLMVSTDRCHSWQRLRMVPRTAREWTQVTVDLTDLGGQDINLGFKGLVDDDASGIAIDNVELVSNGHVGIERLSDPDGLRVTALDGVIAIDGATGMVSVYTLDGRLYHRTDARTIHVSPGLYIVVANGIAQKVIVN